MNDMEVARLNNPRHTGAARTIREALRLAREPLSVYRLHLITGLKPKAVKYSLSRMITGTGGIVSQRGPHGTVYTLYKSPEKKDNATKGEFAVAGRIEIPQYRWGASRLG